MRSFIQRTFTAVLSLSLLTLNGAAFAADDRLDEALEGGAGPVVSSKFNGSAAAVTSRSDARGGVSSDRYRDQSYRDSDYRRDRYRDRPRSSDVRCASRRGRYRECEVGYDIANIDFIRRTDDCRCRRGRDWGYTRSGIWVDNGCSAIFRVTYNTWDRGYRDDDYGYDDRRYRDHQYRDRQYRDRRYGDRYGDRRGRDTYAKRDSVLCSSFDRRHAVCNLPRGARDIRLTKRWSDASCRRGKDWGINRGRVWVDNGCRASFSYVYPAQYAYDDDRRRRY
ncbi:MAG: DUF3011 domain-containing protein [Pseudomonadota bacterium]